MKLVRSIVLAGCVAFLLSSCASQDEIRKLNYQIRTVNQKIDDVRTNTVNKIQKRQASSVNKIDAVSSETEQLRALIEESDHKEAMLRETNTQSIASLQGIVDQMRTDNEQRMQALEAKIDQLTSSLERVQNARVRAAEQRAKEAARRAEEARRRTVAAASSPTSTFVVVQPSGKKIRIGKGLVVRDTMQATGQNSGRETVEAAPLRVNDKKAEQSLEPAAPAGSPFGQGMSRFNAGQYKKAYKSFEQVLSSNPQGEKAAQTLFYMGECLYNQGEFDLAILDYQKVISNHAGDSHTPAALLKQGMAFEKLTDLETAKIIFKKLVVEYPDSSEAGIAQKRLANL